MRAARFVAFILTLAAGLASAGETELVLDLEPLICRMDGGVYEHGWFPLRPILLTGYNVQFIALQSDPAAVSISLWRMPGYRHLVIRTGVNRLERLDRLPSPIPFTAGEWLLIQFWCYDEPGPHETPSQRMLTTFIFTVFYE